MLFDVIDAIQAELSAEWGVNPNVKVGSRFLSSNIQGFPRIVWVLPKFGEERHEAPEGPGDDERGRALRTLVSPCTITVHAVTPQATDLLARQLRAAIHHVCVGSYQLGAAGWLSENESFDNNADVYAFVVELRTPIIDLPPLSVVVESAEVTPALGDENQSVIHLPLPLPERHSMSDITADPEGQTVEAWREQKGTKPLWFNAAKAQHDWPEGLVVTEKTYDEALNLAQYGVIR